MNDKINVLKMVDDKLDKAVKIQGTDFDRKRKVTSEMRDQMKRMKKRGKTFREIAERFNVDHRTVRYSIDEQYRTYCKAYASGVHTGKTHLNKTNRVAYKRELVAEGLI